MKLLLEDATDDLINKAISIIKSTSQPVQGALTDNYDTNGNPVFDASAIRSAGGYAVLNWVRAQELATNDDLKKLAEAFVILLEARYPNFAADIKDSREVFLHILADVGFDQKSNPFIRYVERMFIDGKKITKPQLILLNNLYADGTIDVPDLERDKSSILYNPFLWAKPSNEAEDILRNYYYVRGHHGSYDENVSKKQPTIKGRVAAHPDDMENYIITTDGNIKNGNNFEDLSDVNEFVNTYFKGRGSSILGGGKTPKPTTTSKLPINKKQALEKAIADGSLKYSEIKDILSYLEELHLLGKFK